MWNRSCGFGAQLPQRTLHCLDRGSPGAREHPKASEPRNTSRVTTPTVTPFAGARSMLVPHLSGLLCRHSKKTPRDSFPAEQKATRCTVFFCRPPSVRDQHQGERLVQARPLISCEGLASQLDHNQGSSAPCPNTEKFAGKHRVLHGRLSGASIQLALCQLRHSENMAKNENHGLMLPLLPLLHSESVTSVLPSFPRRANHTPLFYLMQHPMHPRPRICRA